jgi:transposase-like protein
MFRHYSQKEKLRAVKLYQEGYGSTTISQQTGISLSYVKRIINCYLEFGVSGLEKRSCGHFTPEYRMPVVVRYYKNVYLANRQP